MARRGLIVGKFFPPHRGHKYLIDTARANVDELTVIVCRKEGEDPDAALRAEWLREIHPDVRVLLIEDVYDSEDSQLWADLSVGWLGYAPEVVFTSEEYGHRFARCLGCEHVQVDLQRIAIPISGTKVRTDPFGCWDYLEPPVRVHYAKRICLAGAESTGKTTLAEALAAHYHTVWVPEYGREYSERMLEEIGGYRFESEDFLHIARTQCERENAAAREANRLLICDTDAFATAIWHRRYMGERSHEVEALAARHRCPDLYLLTDVNTPFVQDGTRDGEAIRDWMHEAFVEELTAQGRPFVRLTGSFESRFRQAVAAIEELIEAFRP